MVDNSVRVLSLCSGYGGLDLGLRLALPAARTVCYVENEVAAVRILAARFEDGTLDPAPVWSDLKTFDGKPWRGRVHCLTAGYPCQPFSCAGKQRAEKDPRHLWPQVARIVGEVQPEFVFLENVSNHLRLGFRSVVEDLGKLGYRVHAGIFSAEEVGAPHLRKRLFALAYREERGFGILRQPSWRDGFTDRGGAELADAESRRKERRTGRDAASRQSTVRRSAELEHANGEGWHDGRASGNGAGVGGGNEELRPALAQSGRELENTARAHVQPGRRRRGVSQAGDELADARHGLVSILRRQAQGRTGVRPAGEDVEHSAGAQRALRARGGQHDERRTPARPGTGSPLFPPGPNDLEAWKELLKTHPHLEPAVCGKPHGAAPRNDRLRACGNGVVPLVVAFAFRTLTEAANAEGRLNRMATRKIAA